MLPPPRPCHTACGLLYSSLTQHSIQVHVKKKIYTILYMLHNSNYPINDHLFGGTYTHDYLVTLKMCLVPGYAHDKCDKYTVRFTQAILNFRNCNISIYD